MSNSRKHWFIRHVEPFEQAHWAYGLAWRDIYSRQIIVMLMPFCFITRAFLWLYWGVYGRFFRWGYIDRVLMDAADEWRKKYERQRLEDAATIKQLRAQNIHS